MREYFIIGIDPIATFFPAGAPEGDNVALTFFNDHQGGNEFGIEQTLTETLQPNTTYTLTAQVGNIASGVSWVAPYSGFGFFDLRGFSGYRIELLAGGNVVAQDDSTLLPSEGEFLPSTVEVTIGDAHAQLGQLLGIRLINLNQQDIDESGVDLKVDFDDIVLDASPFASADFDSDGDVDGDDFLAWQGGFGTQIGATHEQGDADGDGDVDGDDFLQWQSQFGTAVSSTSGGAGAHAIPEPSAVGVLIAAILALTLPRMPVPIFSHAFFTCKRRRTCG